MTEQEKEVIKEAEDRGAVYAEKTQPTTIGEDSVWIWIYFTDIRHSIVDCKCFSSNDVNYCELFGRLKFNKKYLLKDLKIGIC